MTLMPQDVRVLVSEDHFAVRQMLAKILLERGVACVDMATTGTKTQEMIEEAMAQERPYHVIFLDWNMPEITGLDTLRRFREMDAYANTAFVMVTAMSLQSQVLDAIKAGATAYMIKPVSMEAIGKKFDEVLDWVREKQGQTVNG